MSARHVFCDSALRSAKVIWAGALKFWQQRSHTDFRAAEEAVWEEEAVEAALQSADSWIQGLEYVCSLAGLWKFHLACCPEEVPEQFSSVGFDDSSWGSLPGVKIGYVKLFVLVNCVSEDLV